MYNVVKRRLEIAAAILAIITGGLEIIGGIILLIAGAATGMAGIIVLAIFDLGLAAAFLTLGIMHCMPPVKMADGKFKSRMGRNIGLSVVCASYVLLAIICLAIGGALFSVFVIISFILSMVIEGLIIGAICCKVTGNATTATVIPTAQKTNNASVDGKIKELKRLKDLGVLSDEQYGEAVAKIIQKEAE